MAAIDENYRTKKRVKRWSLRTLIIVLSAFAIYALLPQVGSARAAWSELRHAHGLWLLLTLLMAATTFVGAAVSIQGAAARRLPLLESSLAQVAGAFTNRLAPAGIGAIAANLVYLTKTGSPRSAAVAAVGLDSVAGVIVHVVSIITFATLAHSQLPSLHLMPSDPELPDRWIALIVVAILLVVIGLTIWGVRLAKHTVPPIKRALRSMLEAMRNPRACTAMFGGSAIITLSNILALTATARAFDLTVPFFTIGAIYLGATAVSAAAPTPGGLGAIEAALVAALTATGAAAPAAVACVLVFRLITFWLPILPGSIIYRTMRRNGTL